MERRKTVGAGSRTRVCAVPTMPEEPPRGKTSAGGDGGWERSATKGAASPYLTVAVLRVEQSGSTPQHRTGTQVTSKFRKVSEMLDQRTGVRAAIGAARHDNADQLRESSPLHSPASPTEDRID